MTNLQRIVNSRLTLGRPGVVFTYVIIRISKIVANCLPLPCVLKVLLDVIVSILLLFGRFLHF